MCKKGEKFILVTIIRTDKKHVIVHQKNEEEKTKKFETHLEKRGSKWIQDSQQI